MFSFFWAFSRFFKVYPSKPTSRCRCAKEKARIENDKGLIPEPTPWRATGSVVYLVTHVGRRKDLDNRIAQKDVVFPVTCQFLVGRF
jgi:hypothetical protein